MPKITLEHVEKRFDKFVAVKDLNMVIDDRDFITLLGPSGCGKTTTLRMIAGLESPTEGKITIGDKVVFDAAAGIDISPAKREIGFLFQNYALWPHMTVFQNIAFGLQNLKWSKPEIRKRVDEMLTMLKIEGLVFPGSAFPRARRGRSAERSLRGPGGPRSPGRRNCWEVWPAAPEGHWRESQWPRCAWSSGRA